MRTLPFESALVVIGSGYVPVVLFSQVAISLSGLKKPPVKVWAVPGGPRSGETVMLNVPPWPPLSSEVGADAVRQRRGRCRGHRAHHRQIDRLNPPQAAML